MQGLPVCTCFMARELKIQALSDRFPAEARGRASCVRHELMRRYACRVHRSVELHPTEPWILANLYSGNIYIWNYVTSMLVKSFEVRAR